MNEIRFVAATGVLGVGVHEPSLDKALDAKPHFIAADAGTTDAGPFALGSGKAAFARDAVRRDLDIILRMGRKGGIPVLIGSAGTAGADIHVDWLLEIARDIARHHGLSFKVAVIRSQQDKAYLQGLLAEDRIVALDPAPYLDAGVIERSERIVGMMGVEPLQQALAAGVDLILAGRCSDPALYAALPIARGLPPGLAWHAGKIAECGTMCCETSGKGVIMAAIRADEALIWPVGDGLRCTPQSVAAHSLYESGDPYIHKECSGTLDLSQSTFEAADDKTVRIRGSQFLPAERYTVKLEGAERIGFQTIMIGGVRDPYIIRQLDDWLAKIKGYIHASVAGLLPEGLTRDDYEIVFHVYGRNAVMGALEPHPDHVPQEVGIVVEATAPTQALATTIAKLCRQPLLHAPIAEWKGAITGYACLHNPAEIERGAVYRFNLNHVAVPRAPGEMFRTSFETIGGESECAA
ncbi:acyclic terpene utilization AtuA family protein [soil metagenome]